MTTNDEKPAVPVVDISEMSQATADKLVEAASTVGFVFIDGSDFTSKDVDDAFKLSKGFFDLPQEEKEKVLITEKNSGYSNFNQEILDPENQTKGDPKEAYNVKIFDPKSADYGQTFNPYFEKNMNELSYLVTKCHNLCLQLLTLLAMGLKVDEKKGGKDWFASRHAYSGDGSNSILRFLHYLGQKSADPQEQIRAGAHTDYGSLTLLFQKEGEDGLEILSPITKRWTPVPYIGSKHPGKTAIIINIADLMSFWTAGCLKSSIHRVKFPASLQESGKDRYSIVYFCHPQNEVPIVEVPSPIVQKIEGRGANNRDNKVITAFEHLEKRLGATYGWKKQESVK